MSIFSKQIALICAMEIFIAANGNCADTTTNESPSLPQPETAREFYNAGTQKLHSDKLSDAEALLLSSIAKQDKHVQPQALYNLGEVRFSQGNAELKKSPSAPTATASNAMATGANAIQQATSALATNDLRQLVDAYIAGRGARRELTAATLAVQQALQAHGKTLLKWRLALSNFKSAAELNPADTNAVQNAKIVERKIAQLVDEIKNMQQADSGLANQQAELGALMKLLKGKIPNGNLPGGAAGNEGDDGEDGRSKEQDGLSPEALTGLQESAPNGGQEMELQISPELAGQLLNGIQPDTKLLTAGMSETNQPQEHPKKIW